MNVLVKDAKNYLNVFDKKCLKGTDDADYCEEEDASIKFEIYDDNGNLIGDIVGNLAPGKAGIQLVSMHTPVKDLHEKEKMLLSVIDTIWNANALNHYVLAIHFWVLESGVDYTILEHIGFTGLSGNGSQTYTLLNPDYVNMIHSLATDSNALDYLIRYYNRWQLRKARQLQELQSGLQIAEYSLNDSSLSPERVDDFKRRKAYYEEAIRALGSLDQIEEQIKR